MKLHADTYSSHSIAHRETDSGNIAAKSWDPVIRCDMFAPNTRETGLDLAEIEWQARAAQSAWIAQNLKAFGAALVRKLRARSNGSAATTGLKTLHNKAA
ncbi:MAG: hypothetical protein A3G25_08965 [Betaproteobacteria bacterium RIFCSPLOWO2_12_FULL_63_13]|nr:MAG: hypothetical protein A3H32_16490 [Betaproteobacteria bacterium RIFCSPLOWO2_02_FULL_63_19]OGA50618.1 MAG: hypothetical protein A3G25_08965 [Betaproteobacteria bacterium RIFCSPLOWO2_12_FULL_63_13]